MSTEQPAIQTTSGRTLGELEATIDRGKQTFIEVGLALMEIRDRRLYRAAGFNTFEQYCIGRWQFSRVQAHRLVEAAHVAQALADGLDDKTLPIGNVPATESQARELAPLVKTDPEQARYVWRELTEEAEATEQLITATKVRAAVQRTREPQVENVEAEVVAGPDPRLALLEEAIRLMERCQRARKDVYIHAFRRYANEMRSTLKDMRTDPRLK